MEPYKSLTKELLIAMTLKALSILAVLFTGLPCISLAESDELEKAKFLIRQRDFSSAVEIYKTLANQGDPEAQYLYSSMLRSGRGTKKDDAEALEWTRKAAIQNHVKAQYTLGNMLHTGFTAEIDEPTAKFWYEKAAKQGHKRAKEKLESLASVPSSISSKYRELLLRHAAQKGDLIQVKKLMESNTNMNAIDEFGRTALMDAALNNKQDVTNYLIDKGANPNITDRYGDTALHLAAKNGYLNIIRALGQSIADLNLPDKNGNSPLMLAIIGSHNNTAHFLISNKADIHMRNIKQQDAITLAN
ncbi:MAG: ankyrin repeat domain-containing protein, partial [Thiotrichaceae bacterium]|nr:ankyrin repeat domain-containing protein [Thiotrichaceae bacterium]